MDEILKISKKYNIPVIEDAAEAIGSEYKGKKAGSMGDFGVFSFHGTKTMTTGEGGALVSNREDLKDKILQLENHGRSLKCKKLFYPEIIGYKYKISNIQAALGCAQLDRLNQLVERKRQIFFLYKQLLSDMDLDWNIEHSYTKNSFWMPTIVFKNREIDRDEILNLLIKENIQARPFFYPLSSLPMFKTMLNNKISYDISKKSLNLPSAYDLNEKDIQLIAKILKNKTFMLQN